MILHSFSTNQTSSSNSMNVMAKIRTYFLPWKTPRWTRQKPHPTQLTHCNPEIKPQPTLSMKLHSPFLKCLAATVTLLFTHPLLQADSPKTVSAEDKVKKVLVIGIDGVRPDALAVAETPNLDRLIADGSFSDTTRILGERYRESRTSSGPGWSSILTGVWADKHGVQDNAFRGANFEQYPHFFERVKEANPDAFTVSMISWGPINQFIVSAADIRHVESLPGSLNLAVPADGEDTRDGQWHHLLGVRSDGRVTLFLNGEEMGSVKDTAGQFDLEGDQYYLRRDTRTRHKFEGELANSRLWNRALTRNEIEKIYAHGPEAPGLPREGVASDGLLLQNDHTATDQEFSLNPDLRGVTQDDFTIETWFKSEAFGRGILMGNYRRGRNALNLELGANNTIRLFMQGDMAKEPRLLRENMMDRDMAAAASRILRDTDPEAMFVYFHEPDAAGHTVQFSPETPEYVNAIENVDECIGTVIQAVQSRPTYPEEDWLIIVSTDHGGLGTRHSGGNDIPEIYTVFLIVSGPSAAKGKIEEQTYLVDIVPTALQHLGIPIDPEWNLDGRPVGLKP